MATGTLPTPEPPPPTTTTPLIPAGDTWRYLDNGSNQGSAWAGTAFDDSAWKSGKAELGYGDGDESTIVSFGTSSSNKFITTYFRRTFNVADPSAVTGLLLKLLRDDGAVVYLNGTEIYRTNMPTGAVSYTTAATSAIEDTTWYSANVSPSLLRAGSNALAVEIHQSNRTSSDISFNCSLTATVISSATATTSLAVPAKPRTTATSTARLVDAVMTTESSSARPLQTQRPVLV